jgi:hypothetical protein
VMRMNHDGKALNGSSMASLPVSSGSPVPPRHRACGHSDAVSGGWFARA